MVGTRAEKDEIFLYFFPFYILYHGGKGEWETSLAKANKIKPWQLP